MATVAKGNATRAAKRKVDEALREVRPPRAGHLPEAGMRCH